MAELALRSALHQQTKNRPPHLSYLADVQVWQRGGPGGGLVVLGGEDRTAVSRIVRRRLSSEPPVRRVGTAMGRFIVKRCFNSIESMKSTTW